MRRMPTRRLTPSRLAKELAAQVRGLGGSQAAVLAVFGRFVVPDGDELAERVARLPAAARGVWSEALALHDVSAAPLSFDRDLLLTEINRRALPVLPEGHLFELLLRELDGEQRRQRGVYYTPQPLVSHVVRRVGRLVEEHFAGRSIHLIDPACGYGAFLWEASRARPLVAAMQRTGIELCPTTWAVAHLLLSPIPNLLNANPLTAGESLREAILGPSGQPLVPVIVGNPPWSNFGRLNHSSWMAELLADYRTGLSERKLNLADDAIKFLRWGQHWIDQAGAGILAFVTPNTWLAGLTHRRMRQSLLETFDELHIVDLHGETGGPAGDENVFGIRSGVAIVVMVRTGKTATCSCASLHGSRQEKFERLVHLHGEAIQPSAPQWKLTPHQPPAALRASNLADYATFWPLDKIFRHYISGVQTKNDAVFVGFTREELAEQVQHWLARQAEPLEFDACHIRPYFLAPFDRRWIYYDPLLLGRPRLSVMRHMLQPNRGLVFMRQSTGRGEYDHFLAVECLVSDRVFYSRHGAPFVAPLWQYPKAATSGRGAAESGVGGRESGVRESNFAAPFLAAMTAILGSACEPLGLFHYLYAVAHGPTYRRLFGDELRRDFPRLPLPRDAEAFLALADLGKQLVRLHVGATATEAEGQPANGEPFCLGGYDVLRRWRSPRERRAWTAKDEEELVRLAWIGCETRRLMREVDRITESRRGTSAGARPERC